MISSSWSNCYIYKFKGGTLDVTAHESLADDTIKEIYKVTGGAYGGIYVDEKFVSLLENLFGIPAIKDFRLRYPAEWLQLMNDFEMKKRGRRAFDDKVTRITLPPKFVETVSGTSGLAGHHDVKILNNQYLCLGPETVKQMFQPVVSGIVSHMETVLKRPELNSVNCLFMVGGFAESVILQEAIKTAFSSRCKILIPNDPSIAVVQGATMFGQKTTTVSSRVMATTYGFSAHQYFDAKVHPPEKKIIVEGTALCKDVFDVVVKENDVVNVGEIKRFTRAPFRSDSKSVLFRFFTSTDPNVKYTTDASVGLSIGQVVVESPDTSKGRNRDIELCVFFGGTEIKATAIDKTSGNAATVYLDFLSKS